jgi:hypothetical protein
MGCEVLKDVLKDELMALKPTGFAFAPGDPRIPERLLDDIRSSPAYGWVGEAPSVATLAEWENAAPQSAVACAQVLPDGVQIVDEAEALRREHATGKDVLELFNLRVAVPVLNREGDEAVYQISKTGNWLGGFSELVFAVRRQGQWRIVGHRGLWVS